MSEETRFTQVTTYFYTITLHDPLDNRLNPNCSSGAAQWPADSGYTGWLPGEYAQLCECGQGFPAKERLP